MKTHSALFALVFAASSAAAEDAVDVVDAAIVGDVGDGEYEEYAAVVEVAGEAVEGSSSDDGEAENPGAWWRDETIDAASIDVVIRLDIDLLDVEATLVQDSVAETVETLGGSEVALFSITPILAANVPVTALDEIAELPLVRWIERADAEPRSHVAYTGLELNDAVQTRRMYLDFYRGENGGRAGRCSTSQTTCFDLTGHTDCPSGQFCVAGRVRIGIVEVELDNGSANLLASNHLGFLDTPGGANRVKGTFNCSSTSCTTTASLPVTATHGTSVAWVAAGNIQEGQDPAVTNTLERQFRSGTAVETEVFYYRLTGSNNANIVRAIEKAVADGVDVINMSLGFAPPLPPGGPCGISRNVSSINEAITSATNSGVLHVGSAGNDGHLSTCNVEYPCYRPEVLCLAGIDTDPVTTDYQSAAIATTSPIGGISYPMFGGGTGTIAGIDLAAPNDYSYDFTSGPGGYNTTLVTQGTSFASPAAAGAAAQLKDAFASIGAFVVFHKNPRILHVNMLLNGNHWPGTSGGAAPLTTGTALLTGTGRLRMEAPTNTSLATPWQWTTLEYNVALGTTATFNLGPGGGVMPAGVQQVEAVVETFTFNGSGQMPRFTVELLMGPTSLRHDQSTDMVKAVDYRDATGTKLTGKTMQLKIHYTNGPAAFETFRIAVRWHGGPAD